MLNLSSIKLSRHAEARLLERTSLAGELLLERFTAGAVFWLPVKQDDGAQHGLVYCATTEAFFVAVVVPGADVVKTILTAEQWENTYTTLLPLWRTLTVQLTLQSFNNKQPWVRLVSVDLAAVPPSMDILWSASPQQFRTQFHGFDEYRIKQQYPEDTTAGIFSYVWGYRNFQNWLFLFLTAHPQISPTTHELFLVVGPHNAPMESLPAASVWALIGRRVSKELNYLWRNAKNIPTLSESQKFELTSQIERQRGKLERNGAAGSLHRSHDQKIASAQREACPEPVHICLAPAPVQKTTSLVRRNRASLKDLAPLPSTEPDQPDSSTDVAKQEFEDYIASIIRKRQEVLAAEVEQGTEQGTAAEGPTLEQDLPTKNATAE